MKSSLLPFKMPFPTHSLFRLLCPENRLDTCKSSYPSNQNLAGSGVTLPIANMHTVPKLKDPSLFIEKAYVNGEFTSAASGETFEVHDPSSGQVVGVCPEMSRADVEQAVGAATEAFSAFRHTLARERASILMRWFDLMTENLDDLATLITWESGKPLADSRGEVAYAASFLRWFSEEAPRLYGDTIPATIPGNRIVTWRQPVGVCALITPWNFPAAMITRKIAPAIAAGCSVVVKSPGETPFTANALAMLAARAGMPKGVINIVTALKNTPAVGETLTTDPRIKKLSFTGSTGVGKLLMQQAASTMKKVSFELGGNAPFIVFEDCADIDSAVAGAIASKFRSSGQTCVCANRIYVHASIYEQFASKFVEKVRSFNLGYGFDEGVTHGPLIHDRAVQKVDSHVKDAQSKGAKVLIGGERRLDLGRNFYSPTVLAGVTHDMQIAHEETFGPVAGLISFETEQEVVKLANDTPVGLAGYFFSRDVFRIYRVAEMLEVGMVGVNTGVMSDAASPFGGIKESGLGKEGSKYGMDDFTIVKSMTLGGISHSMAKM
jgi:succinate-semialdehyde dehydrogenase / glutarate-semialdehyde dehydrogenase